MNPKIRIINGKKYIPVNLKKAIILQNAGVKLYKIDNLKTLFIKVNNK